MTSLISSLPRSPGKAHVRSTNGVKAQKTGQQQQRQNNRLFGNAEARLILDNFDLETAERRRALEKHIEAGLDNLKRQLANEVERIRQSIHPHTLTAGQYIALLEEQKSRQGNKDGGHGVAEDQGVLVASIVAAMNERRLKEAEAAIEDDIQRTAKKRKRTVTVHDENAQSRNSNSPTKPHKLSRLASSHAPPTPTSRAALAGKSAQSVNPAGRDPMPRSVSRSHNIGRGGLSSFKARVSQAPSSISNAGNFVYRARPSMNVGSGAAASTAAGGSSTSAFNPRLPQTPQIRQGGAFPPNRNASIMATARRMPRRNESIQAYSMNGSPLGVLDLDIESAGPAEEEQHTVLHGTEVDGEWEVLDARQANIPHQANGSPHKFLRKGTGSQVKSSSIFASPSKHQQQQQHPSHSQSQPTTSARPPSQKDFNFVPSSSSRVFSSSSSRTAKSSSGSEGGANALDPAGLPAADEFTKLSEKYRAELESLTASMSLNEGDRKRLEHKMLSLMMQQGR